jgi:hypothetical protein
VVANLAHYLADPGIAVIPILAEQGIEPRHTSDSWRTVRWRM